ncbi:HemK2/MTQ2 family protein methyltransferase [Peterkaempfera bronchialis]|uniref:HemK2/MTQ2 family protein methyltransferase n=1 Tax=Peterkaempfera bronchialis TaxID=2126346 RepID=UPI003C2EC185
MLLRPPGVYRPQGDTRMLARALRRASLPYGARVLDLCTGTGALALAAARAGANATAVDVSRRAVLTARLNAAVHRVPLRVLLGDLAEPVAGETFDAVLANPPYVIRAGASGPAPHSRARAWDAGADGRALLDRVCAEAPRLLAPGGLLLLVHSELCGVHTTLAALRAAGLKAAVVDRGPEPFGPVMRARAAALERHGVIGAGQRHEELVVIRADRPCRP